MIVSNETIVKEWLDVKRPAGFDLESFLPYRLSVTTNRVSRAFAAQYEQEFGISIPEWRAIAVLGAFAPLSSNEICERTAAPRGPNAAPDAAAVEQEWACRSPAGDEKGADWAFELGSPNGLMRQGWTRNSLKQGDVVTVLGSRARDGSTNSNARSVTTADGKRLFAGSSQGATP